jgi:hypothetical protein
MKSAGVKPTTAERGRGVKTTTVEAATSTMESTTAAVKAAASAVETASAMATTTAVSAADLDHRSVGRDFR